MNDLSSSTQFSIPLHRSIEIRETVKQNLNNMMKNIEEYNSLCILCKEVSIEYCNNKIGMRYDCLIINLVILTVLLPIFVPKVCYMFNMKVKKYIYIYIYNAEQLYEKYLECCNSFRLLKEQYVFYYNYNNYIEVIGNKNQR